MTPSPRPSVLVELKVYSGRSQPPASTYAARVGERVTVRVRGLGPPKIAIRGPDGGIVASSAMQLGDGTEHAFVPITAGSYLVEQTDVGLLATIRASD